MISYNNGIYCQNEQMLIPISDPGFMRSQAAYEAIRVYEGQLFDFQGHYDRFLFSIKELMLPGLKVDLKKICESLSIKNQNVPSLLRIYQTAGIDQKGATYVLAEPLDTQYKKTSKICTFPNFRTHPLIKATHYAPALSANTLAMQQGFDETLFVSEKGDLLELSFSNFFAIKDDLLLTPEKDVLPGITRKHLLKLASSVGLIPTERVLNIRELPSFDEVFHSNTTKEIVPITQINDIIYPCHKKTLTLHEAFKKTLTTNSLRF